MLKKFKQIMIISAHPDDEVIGCGGTIAMLSKFSKITLLILTNGEGSRNYKSKLMEKKIIERKKNLTKSSKNLGIQNIIHENLDDNELDKYSNLKITKLIETHLRKIKPDTIFTHHSSDLNIDHKKVHQAVLTATRPFKNNYVRNIFAFEIPSSTDSNYGKKVFKPNYFVDITKGVKKKIKSLKIYKNQFSKLPSPLNINNIINLAKLRGNTIGCKFAEAFEVIRIID